MPAEPFAMPLRVRYVECDMQGRVFNAHYLTWVDMAHTEALSALVGDYDGLVAGGIDVAVAAADLQFRRPALYGDQLTVLVSFKPPGHTSLQSAFTIVRDDTVLAQCLMTHVCVDTATYTKQRWPDWVRDRLNSASGSY